MSISIVEMLKKVMSIFPHFSNNKKANEETFDSDGWMRTGDIGYYDKEGFLFIVDRIKELIKVKGLQVQDLKMLLCCQSPLCHYAGGSSRVGGCPPSLARSERRGGHRGRVRQERTG